MCEVDWVVCRAKLYDLYQQDPEISPKELAAQLGRSEKWVRKWIDRFKERVENKETMGLFAGVSRARHTNNKQVGDSVVRAVLKIRDEPPGGLKRLPGPKTILYYLHQDEELKNSGVYIPKSTSTVWGILDQYQRIYRENRPRPQPEERSEPMADWQIDFKSNSTVPADEEGKKQHVVETLNVVDKGTSILVSAITRPDFRAETAIETLIDVFRQHGLPETIRFDRDPRFVGSWSATEFPSAMMRLLYALDVTPIVCPPHRPQKNAYVERYHRSYQEECLGVYRPSTLAETIEVTQTYQQHYNFERPHQGLACQNQPPRVAYPDAKPAHCLPQAVDPDAWLLAASRRIYKRRVNTNGSIQIGRQRYYVSSKLVKQRILIRVLPTEQLLAFYLDNTLLNKKPIKGLHGEKMVLADYVDLICHEALAESRTLAVKSREKRRRLAHA